jgi:3-hydroxyisobutyrate dehydrogenase
MRIGFIGLGNVGAKLAGSLLRNGHDLVVRDLAEGAAAPLLARGAGWGESPAAMARDCEVVITCLPSPEACAAVVEGEEGLLQGLAPGRIWAEMSTTDAEEVRRLGALVAGTGAAAADCPVSGGCHRAATGNISILAGCERAAFDRLMPVLAAMGRRILHTGPLGSASTIKVVTNYLATANLIAVCEALAVCRGTGTDLATAYEAIRVSSGTSFVHETESQVILSGSRQIDFTMDLVLKDIGLFQGLAERAGVPLELNPLAIRIMEDGAARYGARAQSDEIVRRLEEATGLEIRADGFPEVLEDDEPEEPGAEVRPRRG